jgi:exodeoxyribonuclease VII small subunit
LTLELHRFKAPEMAENSPPVDELSFEAALKRLEEIVHKLESGEASLDEAIAL